MKRVLYILALFCFSACQETTNNKVAANETLNGLTDEQYAAIGYVVKFRVVVDQTDWEKEQFGLANATYPTIKSTTETIPGSHMYP